MSGGWWPRRAWEHSEWLWRNASSQFISVLSSRSGADDLRWTNQRIAFKKPLHSQPVIRAKLALMIERVEACQAWIENITHQMNNVRRVALNHFDDPEYFDRR